jgi:hypothetical protein
VANIAVQKSTFRAHNIENSSQLFEGIETIWIGQQSTRNSLRVRYSSIPDTSKEAKEPQEKKSG